MSDEPSAPTQADQRTEPAIFSRTEQSDGMRIEWNVGIEMSDGIVLRADVFRPLNDEPVPVLITYGPYGKGLHYEDGYPTAWAGLVRDHPEVLNGSSGKYSVWEVPDPEKWVPDGYAIVRVDSRGAGCSPGVLDHFSQREALDFAACIEWAADQRWSNGKVGVNGVSYFAIMAWRVAALEPKGLAAICVWEGAGDHYRDALRHGGILCTFESNWSEMQVQKVQYGYGNRGFRSRVTGELVCGNESFTDEQLRENRASRGSARAEELDSPFYRNRSISWERVNVPLLSAGNWGGQGLHLRGNLEGFSYSASTEKWLEMHGLEHWTHFMTDYGLGLQKRFFGHFLKGEDTGWTRQPAVQLQVRHSDGTFKLRHESEWPIARTDWQRHYLDLETLALATTPSSGGVKTISYTAEGDGVTFLSAPLAHQVEITGPVAARLFVSASTADADLFLVLSAFDPDGEEVRFQGAIDPNTPLAQGWLRASHRKLDLAKSLPYRPYHTHDEKQPLIPGEIVQLDIEILATCIVLPAGYRLALSVRGKDYECDVAGSTQSNFKNVMKGCGPFLHNDPVDRPPGVFQGHVTLHSDLERENFLLLPVVPSPAPMDEAE